MTTSHKKNQKSRKIFLLSLLLVVGVSCVVLALSKHHGNSTKQPAVASASQETKGESASSTKAKVTNTNGASSSEPGDQKSDSGGASSQTLLAPTGNFVSNHHPGENGSPTTETSVCTTTPGASCNITFVKDGVTKSLASQATDRGGSTYWNNWTPESIGLASGSWKVQATVTLNGQTKTTSDATELVVI